MHSPSSLRVFVALALAGALSSCGGGDAGYPPGPVPVVYPAWSGFGGDAQHTALGDIATQNLNGIVWRTAVDVAPKYTSGADLLIHYGSPVVTAHNTVVVPVKTGATGGFRIEAHVGATGALLWSTNTDYVLPAHNWVPSYNLALDTASRVYAPGAGGKLLSYDDADSPTGASAAAVFYGAALYNANAAAFDATVFINTPLTVDAGGNIFFGFIVTGANPAGLVSGLARVAADGTGIWVAADAAANDAAIDKVAMNSAPALSPDGATVYVAVNTAAGSGAQSGYLLALDSASLGVKSRVPLVDPALGSAADVTDDSTASPTVGPDGDVFFGVLEANFGSHNGRGWLLHFDALLNPAGPPGSFGWDDTASIVPASLVPSSTGTSSYLLATKYNNYGGIGTGDGQNRVAVLDPRAGQPDAYSGATVMREVLTLLGPTADPGYPGGVKEWCINTAAVDPLTGSILVNNEDGYLYRWDLRTNTLTQSIQLTSGLGESYTPTAIGADGAAYAINNAVLFSIGQ